ncbi:MAG: hypothetical protein EON55_06935 [Alphaproteobacteria bacterium]|nr:MAG: hypothetical protein EON55_06935 [Alphaproteobacteria bacterium]
MARRRTSETAGPAAEAFAASLDGDSDQAAEHAGPVIVYRPPAQPKRDAKGRFARPGRRMKKGGRPIAGRRGPSYLANKRQAVLVRTCIVLEHKVGRLEAELVHAEWSDPARPEAARMKGIRMLQAAGQDRRMAALNEVLIDMSVERIARNTPKRHGLIAERMSAKLGEPFSWRTLYNTPYRSAWRTIDDALAGHAADDAATFADRARWKKPMLVHAILRLVGRRDELLALLRERLLEETVEEDGWDPIARAKGTD